MAAKVLAFAESRNGKLKKSSLECASEAARLAKKLGGDAVAVVAGDGVAALGAELGATGVARVIALESKDLANYNGDSYGAAVAAVAKQESPDVVLFSATALGKDLAPRVAAHLDAGYAADITGTSVEGGKFLARRPVYAGKSYIEIEFAKTPAVASLRPNNFDLAPKSNGAAAAVETRAPALPAPKSRVKEVKTAAAGAKPDLTEAAIIVTGGRGMKGPEHFALLEKLSAAIPGSVVGASRAVVDAGWRPHSDQVGQTGKTVSPNLYIACGVSGAIQHLAGMRTSKCIVAINKDPEAPIFKVADYGIVGDLFQVVPALEAEFKKLFG
jgi:electron transfer flavoprotein alpha subunit